MHDLIAHTEYQSIQTPSRYEIRDITDTVEQVRAKARLWDGFVLVSPMHITASIFVNDHESGLWEDIMNWLEELAPRHRSRHQGEARPRPVGARSLRRVRRAAPEADSL
jgi:thiamine phosphate synthase YjbQ (UPF0047 family)